MKKLVLATLATFTLLSATSTFANYPGACTREYDPTPYITKAGKLIYAPNPCIAELWAAQGK